jgi:hypothetical protein
MKRETQGALVNAVFIQPGDGYTLTQSLGGASLAIDPQFPFKVRSQFQVYENQNEGVAAISVWPGTVNGVVPKLGGQYIDATPIPKLNIPGNGYVYLTVTRVSGQAFPKMVDINFATAVPADTFNTGNLAIASVTKVGGSLKISQLITTSMIVSRQAYGQTDAVFYWFSV